MSGTSFMKISDRILPDFMHRITRDFCNNGQTWAVEIGLEFEFPEAETEEGYMVFTNEEILACFEPAISPVIDTTKDQVNVMRARGNILEVN
ncbi:hypothetical protein QQX98_004566 [Neonectria punicea]|uniref:Uncharacterized protein n=1 Tax=Neonectria punicea TaxID=979145 RepID=A0ABR1H8T5_9HYPO